MAGHIIAQDPAPGKSLTTLRVGLSNIEIEIQRTKTLLERHSKTKSPKDQVFVDLKPMLREDLGKYNLKKAQLLEIIADKSYYLAQQRSQPPPSGGSNRTSQNARGGNESAVADYVRSQQGQHRSHSLSNTGLDPYAGNDQQQTPQDFNFMSSYNPMSAHPTQNQLPFLTTAPQSQNKQLDHINPALASRSQPSSISQHHPGTSETPSRLENSDFTYSSSRVMESPDSSTGRNGSSSTPAISTGPLQSDPAGTTEIKAQQADQESSRTAPSPYLINNSDEKGGEIEEGEENRYEENPRGYLEQDRFLTQLLGFNASEHEREVEEEYVAAKKQLAEARKRQEKQQRVDEEFARGLQEVLHFESYAHQTPSSEFASRSGSGESRFYGSEMLFEGESFGPGESNDSAKPLTGNLPSDERGPSPYGLMPPVPKSALGPSGCLPDSNNSRSLAPHHTTAATSQASHLSSDYFVHGENRGGNISFTQSLPYRHFLSSQYPGWPPALKDSSRTSWPKETLVIDLTGPSTSSDLQEIPSSDFNPPSDTMNSNSRESPLPDLGQEDDEPELLGPGPNTFRPNNNLQLHAPIARLPQQGSVMNAPDNIGPQLAVSPGQTRPRTVSPSFSMLSSPPGTPFALLGANVPFQFASNFPDNGHRAAQFESQALTPLNIVPGRYAEGSNPNNPVFYPSFQPPTPARQQEQARLPEQARLQTGAYNGLLGQQPTDNYNLASLTGPSYPNTHASAVPWGPSGPLPSGVVGPDGVTYHPHHGPYANQPSPTYGLQQPNRFPPAYGPQRQTQAPQFPNLPVPQQPNQAHHAYGSQHQIQISQPPNVYNPQYAHQQLQQPSNAGLPDFLRDTGKTIANLGSNLVTGATGMFSNAIDAVGTAYNQYGNTTSPSSLYPSTFNTPGESSGTSPFPASPHVSPYALGTAGANQSINSRPTLNTEENEHLRRLLSNISSNADLTTREGTPEGLVRNLYEHQKVGLAWMKSMEAGSNKGGILADDMGLGKTIQAIALMLSNRSTDPKCKTTLIVCSVGLMAQWQKEIKDHVKPEPQHCLSVFTAHSEKGKVPFETLKRYDVVITTYGTLASEYKRKFPPIPNKDDQEDFYIEADRDDVEDLEEDTKSMLSISRSNKIPGVEMLGEDSKWYRVIIDEAQNAKNHNTKTALALCDLEAKYRWCMTGTPMQNGVHELYSLIKFLRIQPYCKQAKFNEDFAGPLKVGKAGNTNAMEALRLILKAFMLRRTKTSTIDGKPIVSLPDKIMVVKHCVFSKEEKDFYNGLENKTQIQYNKYVKAGGVMAHYTKALTLLLRLRQACCHPHLIKDFGDEMTAGVTEAYLKTARDLPAEVVARLLGEEAFVCPLCSDAVENPVILHPCGHPVCFECFGRQTDPSSAEGNAERPGREQPPRCYACRSTFHKEKITSLTSFNKVHRPELAVEAQDEEGEDTDSDSELAVESESEDDGDNNSLADFVVDDDEADDNADVEEAAEPPMDKTAGKRKYSGKDSKTKRVKFDKQRAKPKKPKVTLAQLKKDSLKSADAKKRYLRRLRKTWQSSAKIDKTMELLTEIDGRNSLVDKSVGQRVEKTIIFSQFTSLLDLLEIAISTEKWVYRRYDGTMPSSRRNQAVHDFEKGECTIMLISLKAGNAGLNLTSASQVIIFEPFWNPFIEDQAVDRAYRIGQNRVVEVHRILVEGTVEDRIQSLQTQKRELIEAALDESASQDIGGRLDEENMAFLFGVSRG